MLLGAAATLSLTASDASALRPESQWVYIRHTPDGPAALFLDWTYSSVVLRIHCDRKNRALVFLAPVTPGSDQGQAPHRMDLSINEGRPIAMTAAPVGREAVEPHVTTAVTAVEGRLGLTRRLAKAIARGTAFDIAALNDDDEEGWHVGRAEPFRRVVRDCPTR
jgi:hypothetical protein